MANAAPPNRRASDRARSSVKPDPNKPPPSAEHDPANPLSHLPRGPGDPQRPGPDRKPDQPREAAQSRARTRET